MNTVNINGINVYQKYGMILTSKVIPPATAKTFMINIPGADGVLDITDSMGIVRYNSRRIVLNFSLIGQTITTYLLYQKISNEFNGRKVNVILSEADDFYYEGRCVDMTFEQTSNMVAEMTLTIDALPYAKTVKEFVVEAEGTEDLEIIGSRMPTVPEITVEGGSTNIIWQGHSRHLDAGTYALQDLVLMQGANSIRIDGNAKVKFKYRKGKL